MVDLGEYGYGILIVVEMNGQGPVLSLIRALKLYGAEDNLFGLSIETNLCLRFLKWWVK